MKLREFVWWWLPVVAWCSLIFVLSSIPSLRISEGLSDYLLRKTAHMVVYAILFLLLYRAVIKQAYSVWQLKSALIAIGLTVLYGMSDEFHQSLVPTRSGNWFDVGVDTVGALVAMTGLAWWGWWSRTLREVESETAGRQDGKTAGK